MESLSATLRAPATTLSAAPPTYRLEERHYPLQPLRWVKDHQWLRHSWALIARAPTATTAVVFVHGWHGGALSTWETFPRAMRYSDRTGKVDGLFFGYPSVEHAVDFCAAQFRNFLEDLLASPARSIINLSLPRGEAPRDESWRYERVFIVAHSMGAVVSRRALLDLDHNGHDGTRRVRLLYFAPAHGGSELPMLIASGLGLDKVPGASAVVSLLALRYPSMRQLRPGSKTLEKLLTDFEAVRQTRLSAGESYENLRARVYHANGDKVVEPTPFGDDYPLEPVMGRHHRNICKPDEEYRIPVDALEGLL